MNNDLRIKEMLAKVEAQRKDLGEKPKVSWKTNGIFKYDDRKYLNINVATETDLIESLAFLYKCDSYRNAAILELGINSSELQEFHFNGYPIKDYVEDFKTRISVMKWEKKKNLLSITEKRLKDLVSEEAKTEMELDDINKLLG